MTNNAAAGAQPHALPEIVNTFRAPNYHRGRMGLPILFYVRHNTETAAGNTSNAPSLLWFLNRASGVSIHHLIGRDGTRYDLVQRIDTAYHCGDATWGGVTGSMNGIGRLNLQSIGTEYESSSTAADPGDSYTDEQLWTGAYTEACSLLSYAGLEAVDHRQIAQPPGRRHDPSHFPLETHTRYLNAWLLFLKSVPDAERWRYFL